MKRGCITLVVLVLTAALAGCGGGNAGNLEIQLSPSAPTLSINSSVQISAATTPSINSTSTLTWDVVGYSGQCTEGEAYPQTAPPIPGCNNGYIAYQITSPATPITTVYYFSPSTTGTYQIYVSGQIKSSGQVTYQGNITANVLVTNVTPL